MEHFIHFPQARSSKGEVGIGAQGTGSGTFSPPYLPPPLSLESSFNTPQWEDLFVFLSPPLLLLPDLGESLDLPLPYIIDKDFYGLLFYFLRQNYSVFFFSYIFSQVYGSCLVGVIKASSPVPNLYHFFAAMEYQHDVLLRKAGLCPNKPYDELKKITLESGMSVSRDYKSIQLQGI